ncbi:MAG: GtrA family protein [Oscillospiraceae bacterium]|nr:GtrA family protein [Oscillospiraceae bacterium]
MYVIFGFLTTVVSFAAYFAARWLFDTASSLPAAAFSWFCAVSFAYVANKLWVFRKKQDGAVGLFRECLKFFAVRGVTLLADLLIMFLMVDLTGFANNLYELFVRVVVSLVVLILNYILSKKIVFK